MGERHAGSVEVTGSSPVGSTGGRCGAPRYLSFSSLEEWVHGTSCCFKTHLNISVPALADIFEFDNQNMEGEVALDLEPF